MTPYRRLLPVAVLSFALPLRAAPREAARLGPVLAPISRSAGAGALPAVAAAPGLIARPAGERAVGARLEQTTQALAPRLEAAQNSGGENAQGVGNAIQRVVEDEKERVPVVADAAPASSYLPNPRELYPQAHALALKRAQAWDVSSKRLAFSHVTTTLPAGLDQRLDFRFYVLDGSGKSGRAIYVNYRSSLASVEADSQAGPLPHRIFASLTQDYYFHMGSQTTPEAALAAARSAMPRLRGGIGASVMLRYEETPETGEIDLWYVFLDDDGRSAKVNARTHETRPR